VHHYVCFPGFDSILTIDVKNWVHALSSLFSLPLTKTFTLEDLKQGQHHPAYASEGLQHNVYCIIYCKGVRANDLWVCFPDSDFILTHNSKLHYRAEPASISICIQDNTNQTRCLTRPFTTRASESSSANTGIVSLVLTHPYPLITSVSSMLTEASIIQHMHKGNTP
jgi:hypothetical protein